jgi:hypothetical protein
MEAADVLKAISDNRSLEVFKIVALSTQDSNFLISKTNLTRKQYYSRVSRLMNAGLIKRKNGKLTLSTFGKIIYYTTVMQIENAMNNYWKFKAIDSFEISNYFLAEELEKVIDKFIDNQEFKTVLVSNIKSKSHQSLLMLHNTRSRAT